MLAPEKSDGLVTDWVYSRLRCAQIRHNVPSDTELEGHGQQTRTAPPQAEVKRTEDRARLLRRADRAGAGRRPHGRGRRLSASCRSWLKDLPDYKAKNAFEVAQATKIYSADGKLLARLYLENREVVPISQISPDLVNAVVAVEDERFYQHKGVDPVGLVRAASSRPHRAIGRAPRRSRSSTSATPSCSTSAPTSPRPQGPRGVPGAGAREALHQARDPRDVPQHRLLRRGRVRRRGRLADVLRKPGERAHTAAGRHCSRACRSQPSRLDPYNNPEGAVARRNEVLGRMLAQQLHHPGRSTTRPSPSKLKLERTKEPERRHLPRALLRRAREEAAAAAVLRGHRVQGRADGLHDARHPPAGVRREARSRTSSPSKSDPQAALVSIDPRTGYVKALVGGRDYRKNKFNLATQGKRQPGSSFKTFVLVTALEKGMPPSYADRLVLARGHPVEAQAVGRRQQRGRRARA